MWVEVVGSGGCVRRWINSIHAALGAPCWALGSSEMLAATPAGTPLLAFLSLLICTFCNVFLQFFCNDLAIAISQYCRNVLAAFVCVCVFFGDVFFFGVSASNFKTFFAINVLFAKHANTECQNNATNIHLNATGVIVLLCVCPSVVFF